jgi:hypothetical protein
MRNEARVMYVKKERRRNVERYLALRNYVGDVIYKECISEERRYPLDFNIRRMNGAGTLQRWLTEAYFNISPLSESFYHVSIHFSAQYLYKRSRSCEKLKFAKL